MHEGKALERSIYGEAILPGKKLIEDGMSSLPFSPNESLTSVIGGTES